MSNHKNVHMHVARNSISQPHEPRRLHFTCQCATISDQPVVLLDLWPYILFELKKAIATSFIHRKLARE
jgi:hypothetical protein